MQPERWSHRERPMSLEAIREMYDSLRYRVSEYRYPAGPSFDTRTRAATWFVSSGACRLPPELAGAGVAPTTLTAGDVAEVEAGTYFVEVLGDAELWAIMVWDLAPYMN